MVKIIVKNKTNAALTVKISAILLTQDLAPDAYTAYVTGKKDIKLEDIDYLLIEIE